MAGTGTEVSARQTISVEVAKDGSSYRLSRSAIIGGFAHDPTKPALDSKASALASGLTGIPGALRKNVAVAMPGRDVVYRTAEVGSDNYFALKSLARMEAEEVKGAGSDVLWGHQVIDPPSSGRLLLVAVSREEVAEHYASSLHHAGLRVAHLVPAPIALYHCFLTSGSVDADGCTMVVNVGEASTEVCFVEMGALVAVRSIPAGIETFVTALAQSLGTNAEQARATLFSRVDMRPGHAGVNVSGERAVSSAQDSAAALLQQLMATIAYARAASKSRSLDAARVVMCGPGAAIRGLPEYLASRMRKPFEMLNPLAGFATKDLDNESLAAVGQFGPSLAIPLGLAKIAADQNPGDLKIVPPSVAARRNFLRRSVWLYAGVLLLVVALSVTMVVTLRVGDEAAATLKQARSAKGSYDAHNREVTPRPVNERAPVLARLRELPSLMQEEVVSRQRLSELSESRRPSLDATALWTTLLTRLPSEVTVTAFALEPVLAQDGSSPPCCVVNVFIENSTRGTPVVWAELQAIFRNDPRVAKVDAGVLSDAGGGAGDLGRLTIHLKDTDSSIDAYRSGAGNAGGGQ